ncbi:hypothetical protein N7457_005557 [Penicillium paradoxum]|uniref:uncharacterized protein n=1 Tax=Penicillium paradoxum TaxID=176176 RepID=UPI0025484575|nr:uncharacterized protein N7457_005557 [Penicillium paradoxum]KAJ5780397.1 hypothetical protein N7457_005557 [Penicillium paradoxum]
MAHPRNERYPAGSTGRPFPSRSEHDDFMYDDQSRSRSPGKLLPARQWCAGFETRDRERVHSPHRRPAADGRLQYSRDRESGQGYRGHDRGDYRQRNSRSSPGRGRNTYRDRDREGYRSGSHSRSRSRSPRRGPSHLGQVSREVMMEGLPVDMTEEHISVELNTAYHIDGLEDIRVIRDRQTKLSRKLGFLRFPTIDASRAFVERNHPFIYLYGPSAGNTDRGTKVRIAYSREREDRARAKGAGDWNCRKCFILNFSTRPHCFKCGSPRPADMDPTGPPGVPTPKVANDGDNDAAPENQPSQFLLVRGLEASVSEELLAKGVSKLYRPSGNTESAPNIQKKGSKVASTTGDSNLGAPEGSLRRVLLVRDRRTNESWRYGFAEFAGVADAQAAMARLKSFDKFTISSKPVLVTYIHGGVFVPVINPSSSASHYTFSPANNPSLQLMYWDDAAYVTELKLSTDQDNAAQEQRGGKAASNQQDTQAKGNKDSDKTKKRKADATAATTATTNAKKLSMPSQLQFWSDRHAELHANKDDGEDHAETAPELNASVTDLGALPVQSFADLENSTCYLCWRIFDNPEDVLEHESVSEMHQENLRNEALREQKMREMIKHGVIEAPQAYRDRAKERRQAFGVQDNSGADANSDSSIDLIAQPVTSYADFDQIVCLLCAEGFERPELLVLHERHSTTHEKNMQDEAARAQGDFNRVSYGLIPLPTPTYRAFADDPESVSSYADLKENCCLLCRRKFRSPEAVLLHERVNENHRENLKDKEKRAYADRDLVRSGLATLPTPIYRAFAEDPETISSYADMKELQCHLCNWIFPTPEGLFLHERVNEAHLANMKDKKLRAESDWRIMEAGLATAPNPIYRVFTEDLETFSSYAELGKNICHLCLFQFKTPEHLLVHERVDEPHLEKLKDKEARARGDMRLIEEGLASLPSPVYRFSPEDLECDDFDTKPPSSYADLGQNGCFLCNAQYEKPEYVFLHDRFADMHFENLKSKRKREIAMCALVIRHIVEIPHIYGDSANQKRLKEQRAAFCSDDSSAPPDASYIDPNTQSCWLCWLDFEAPELAILHERIDEAHQEKLKDEALRVRARRALIESGALEERENDENQATERHEAPSADDSNARQKASEPAQEDQQPAQPTSIGASLLRKMGWSAGSGLGAEGTGVTAPISTELYAPGVGLGAQGGKLGDATEEAGRKTRGRYEEFLEKTKDNARQRYEEMDRS